MNDVRIDLLYHIKRSLVYLTLIALPYILLINMIKPCLHCFPEASTIHFDALAVV